MTISFRDKRGFFTFFALLFFLSNSGVFSQQGSFGDFDPDTVKAGQFDTGRMWTFEHAPVDYFEKTYNFRPDQEWLDAVRLASPKFATWCSSSFVSEDGLIMTNHHCIDFVSDRIQREGEDIAKNGFYAPTLQDERKVNGVTISRLELIVDVTAEINQAIAAGSTDAEIIEKKGAKIAELEKKYAEESGLTCNITSLFNGGKYSLYGVKVYDDVRAVYFNEREMGFFGGDPDNYTYPRYCTDFAFLRVYENNKPLKTEHFFKFSKEGAKPGEVLFTIGYPGTTQRLKTVDQLEFLREINFKNVVNYNLARKELIKKLKVEHPENLNRYEGLLLNIANIFKRFGGFVENLYDPYLIARKKAFEREFKAAIFADEELKGEFGHIWEAIKKTQDERRKTEPEVISFTLNRVNSPQHLLLAFDIVRLARQLQLPEEKRENPFKQGNLQATIEGIFPPDFDPALNKGTLAVLIDIMINNLGSDQEFIKKHFGGKSGAEAAEYLLSNSSLTNKSSVTDFIKADPAEILSSDDSLIKMIIDMQARLEKLAVERKEILESEQVLEDQLGRALFEVYGTNIPPDATFTLRIGDGKMASYDYNGTVAPDYTTFYGLYEKHFSHRQEYPWTLTEKWKNPGPEFDLNTPFNFISTHDIVGGSSGSPMINKNREIVGVAFDGNIESLSGSFIYDTIKNRNIGVASQGMLEIVRDLHNYKRLADELENGAILE